jgi:hypothetical protein
VLVTRDNDASPEGAWRSVESAIRNAGLVPPTAPGQYSSGVPTVGVFLIPAADQPGALEDLCLASLADDPVLACADEYFTCIERRTTGMAPAAKARIHAWLAAQTPPGLRLGEAAERGLLPLDHPAFAPLRAFLLT